MDNETGQPHVALAAATEATVEQPWTSAAMPTPAPDSAPKSNAGEDISAELYVYSNPSTELTAEPAPAVVGLGMEPATAATSAGAPSQPKKYSFFSDLSSRANIAVASMTERSQEIIDIAIQSANRIPAIFDPPLEVQPSWNKSFATAMRILHMARMALPRNISTLQMLSGQGIPTWLPTLPQNVASSASTHPVGEWFYPLYGGLKIRRNATPEIMSNGKYILYLHGGAFCCCNPSTHRGLLYRLVDKTQATIFAINYRKPPKHPFPIPVEDCISAFLYILEKVGDAKRIILAGDSAGGNLVLSTLLRISELGLPMPAGGVLISPWVDLTDFDSPSWERNNHIDYLDVELAMLFAASYQGTCGTYSPRDLSPTFSENLHNLPPLLIEVGGCEVLHDQIIAFSRKVEDAGGNVTCNVRPDMVHVFPIYSFTKMPQCEDAFTEIVRFVNQLCPTHKLDDFYTFDDTPTGTAQITDGVTASNTSPGSPSDNDANFPVVVSAEYSCG